MTLNAGYKFTAKKWMAAFLVNAFITATPMTATAATDQSGKHRYVLLDLAATAQRAKDALASGDMVSYAAYEEARIALQETADGLRGTPNDLPGDFEGNVFVADNQGVEYRVINPDGDVDWTTYFLAQKSAQVTATKVPPGTVVQTVMASGMVESSKTAGPNGGYEVVNPDGEHYLVDTAKFEKIYEETATPGTYRPKPDPRKVLQVAENVAFRAPWGEMMYIRAGGTLVHEAHRKVYGIQPAEYAKTYSALDDRQPG